MSVQVGLYRPAGTRSGLGGMKMNMKEKLLLVWVLVMVALSLLSSHFWGWTVYALEKAVALNVVALPSAARYAAAICTTWFLR